MKYKNNDFKYLVEESTTFAGGNYTGILVNTDVDNKYRVTFGHKGVGRDYNVEYDNLSVLAHDIVLFAKNYDITKFHIGIFITLPFKYAVNRSEFLMSLYSKELEQLEYLVDQTSLYCFTFLDSLVTLTYKEALDKFSHKESLNIYKSAKGRMNRVYGMAYDHLKK